MRRTWHSFCRQFRLAAGNDEGNTTEIMLKCRIQSSHGVIWDLTPCSFVIHRAKSVLCNFTAEQWHLCTKVQASHPTTVLRIFTCKTKTCYPLSWIPFHARRRRSDRLSCPGCTFLDVPWCLTVRSYIKGETIPGQALRVPGGWGSQKVSGVWGSQISRQSAHEGGKVVSPKRLPPLTPRKYPWYSFLLQAESTPGPQCGRKDCINEKFQWHHRESNPRPSDL